ncbi:hypothetical protein CUMW_042470 [Citrus unshiu]|nr:hypothetical protein CUMW_042470 [Citrus unshiu]
MKCRSVACIWSGTPPSHRVTATSALTQPPTLYTGGSDGSILWWSFSDSSYSEIKPVAMLCGHSAPIADLSICYPAMVSRDGKAEHWKAENSKAVDIAGAEENCLPGLAVHQSFVHCLRTRDMCVLGAVSLILTSYLTIILLSPWKGI